jgi:predicted transcriptional regulator
LTDFETTLESAPRNLNIVRTLLKTRAVLSGRRRAAISVSGGSDSDIVLDLIERVKSDTCEIAYVFFDTGLEYDATKRHLDDLEREYGIKIERRRPRKPIPVACREFGIPFVCKDVSEMMNRLQNHGFDWNESPEGATEDKYGRCKSALDWYFSRRPPSANGKSKHNINRHKLLREFIQNNPPSFKISDKCCDYAKNTPGRISTRNFAPTCP